MESQFDVEAKLFTETAAIAFIYIGIAATHAQRPTVQSAVIPMIASPFCRSSFA